MATNNKISGGKVSKETAEMLKRAAELHQGGKLVQAQLLYENVLESHPTHADCLNALALIAIQTKNFQRAVDLCDKAIELNGKDAKAHFTRGNALTDLNQLDAAIASYDKAIALQPGNILGFYNRGNNLHFLNRLGDAVASFEKAIAINPNFPNAHCNRGLSLTALHRLDEAVSSFDKAIALQPNLVVAHFNRAVALKEMNQLDAAIAGYDKAIALFPNHFLSYSNRGNALLGLNKLEAAVDSFDKAIAINPEFAIAYANRGTALLGLKQVDAAIASFDRALDIQPDYVEAYLNRGLALQECEPANARLNEAIDMFEKACQLLPDQPLHHLAHAKALAKAGRFAEAEAAARKALAADPIDRNGAGMFLAGLGVVPMPERIPDALLHTLYDARASFWDGGASTQYQGAKLVGDALLAMQRPNTIDILDAGCGTGLVGALVRGSVRRLDGVDMSQPMLNRANEKGLYDSLTCGDLIAFLANSPEKYDAVLSAATLIHFGSLRPIFEATATALRYNGLLIFTIFPNEKDPSSYAVDNLDGMAQGGCYVHGRDYLIELAAETGFTVEAIKSEIHEYDANGKPKMCLLVTLSRQRMA